MAAQKNRTPVDQSVTVTIPAHLRVIVANYLVERAADYEGGRIPEDLVALAAQVSELAVTGRASS